MSGIRYKPRLKKRFLKNQNALPALNLTSLKKLKWRTSIINVDKDLTFLRNDTLILHNQTLDQRKYYKVGCVTKQKFFALFSNLKKKDLKKYFSIIKKHVEGSSRVNVFFNLLIHRLDFMLVKLRFVKTVFQARWLISRGFILVNEKKIFSSSYVLIKGDFVQLLLFNKLAEKNNFTDLSFVSFSQAFLEINYETLSFVVLELPNNSSFDTDVFVSFFDFEILVNF